MKLCPVCDKKIKNGTWCKNCKKFVKPYEIADDIHINESHSRGNDAGCDYHHSRQQYSSVFTKQETAHATRTSQSSKAASNQSSRQTGNQSSRAVSKQSSRQTGKQSSRAASKQSSRQAGKQSSRTASKQSSRQTGNQNKAGKILVCILIIWMVSGILTAFAQIAWRFAKGFSDIGNALSKEDSKKEQPATGETVDLKKAGQLVSVWKKLCLNIDYPELAEVFPEGYWTEDGDAVYYFKPKKLAEKTTKHCSMSHFSKKQEAFELFFKGLDTDFKKMESETREEWNYLSTDGTVSHTCFETEQDYYVSNAVVALSLDTVTNEVHLVYLYSNNIDEFMEYVFTFCSFADQSLELDDKAILGQIDKLSKKVKEDGKESFEEIAEGDAAEVYCGVYLNDDGTYVYCLEIGAIGEE